MHNKREIIMENKYLDLKLSLREKRNTHNTKVAELKLAQSKDWNGTVQESLDYNLEVLYSVETALNYFHQIETETTTPKEYKEFFLKGKKLLEEEQNVLFNELVKLDKIIPDNEFASLDDLHKMLQVSNKYNKTTQSLAIAKYNYQIALQLEKVYV